MTRLEMRRPPAPSPWSNLLTSLVLAAALAGVGAVWLAWLAR